VTAVTVAVWQLQGKSAAAPSTSSIQVSRGDLVVSVRGVGRAVEAGPSGQITVPGAASSSGASTAAAGSAPTGAGGSSSVPADAVFAHAAGRVLKVLVAPGRRVAAGQPLALLSDGGTSTSAVRQAQNDLAAAELDLKQKRTSDPLKGLPPSPAELTAARAAVATAREKLALLVGPARPADVGTARLDVKRATADLETLRGGTATARARLQAVARRNVLLARQRLARQLAPPSGADVSATELEVKRAVAELATLQKPAPPPSPEALAAAQQAVDAATTKLDKLNGPPDRVAVSTARLELAKAESDLADLRQAEPPASQRALAVGQLAVDTARLKLEQLLGPPDPSDLAAAKLDRDRAVAELAALTQPPPAVSPEAVTAARQAITAATLKLAKLLARPPAADVTGARLELQRAEADLRTLQAGPSPTALAAAQQSVTATRSRLTQVLSGALPADVIAARLDIRRALADLAVLRARGGPASPTDVGLSRLRVEAAQARLRVSRVARNQLTVRSPSSGTVTAVLTAPGAPADASTPIATVAALARLEVSVDLSEFDVAEVRRGQAAIVSVDALGGKRFAGRVLFAALAGVDNGGVVTFPVRVGLAHVAGLKPGMNVSVRVVVAQRRNVVRVPLEAVQDATGAQPTVRVVTAQGKSSSRAVELGLSNNKDVEIARGLRQGERVALAGGAGV